MKKRTLNELRQTKNYYEHPYKTKGVNVKELFELPVKYSNDEELGRAFRSLISNAYEVEYLKKYKDGVDGL
jgi:hypothetical protein